MKFNLSIEADSAAELQGLLAQLSGGTTEVAGKKLSTKTNATTAPAADAQVDDDNDGGEPVPTLGRLQEMMGERKAHKDKIKALLGKFGAANIGSLDESHYVAFATNLKKLSPATA